MYSRTVEGAKICFPPDEPLAWAATSHQFDEQPAPVPQRWATFHGNPRSEGVFFIWGHAYEFNRPGHDWSDLERVYRPLAGKDDVWYCTNIELFDYESARRRLVLAANRRSAIQSVGIPVTINVDGKVVDVPPGKTISLG